MNRGQINTLRRRQLDRSLADLSLPPKPSKGWIVEVRNILGMSAAQLGHRLGIRQSTVAKLEQSERDGTITLNSLERLAGAMSCRLVYAIVPETTYSQILDSQAKLRAEEVIGIVQSSMALEGQSNTADVLESEVEVLSGELVRTLSREIWNTNE